MLIRLWGPTLANLLTTYTLFQIIKNKFVSRSLKLSACNLGPPDCNEMVLPCGVFIRSIYYTYFIVCETEYYYSQSPLNKSRNTELYAHVTQLIRDRVRIGTQLFLGPKLL